jgi:hypothetical protein
MNSAIPSVESLPSSMMLQEDLLTIQVFDSSNATSELIQIPTSIKPTNLTSERSLETLSKNKLFSFNDHQIQSPEAEDSQRIIPFPFMNFSPS